MSKKSYGYVLALCNLNASALNLSVGLMRRGGRRRGD